MFTTLFPADCRLCSLPLTNISRLPVCDACLARVQPTEGPGCRICGERLLSGHFEAADPVCGLCGRAAPPFQRALAYGSYDGELRDLVHLLKYERVRPAAAVLGRMLREALAPVQPEIAEAVIVPVPLHSSKLRQRGFNQAMEIARAAFGRDPGWRERVNGKILVRTRATDSQTGLTPHQRRENVRGAFAVNGQGELRGRDVLLVDDVFTTGTTAAECTRVLLRAGARQVFVGTVARVMKLEATSTWSQESYEAAVMRAHA